MRVLFLSSLILVSGCLHPAIKTKIQSDISKGNSISASTIALLSEKSVFNNTFLTEASSIPRPGSYAITAGDLDGDGRPEWISTDQSNQKVYIHKWVSSFNDYVTLGGYSTGSSPAKVVVADIDGDGKPEIITADTTSSQISIFRNTSTVGNISFVTTAVTIGVSSQPSSLVVADIDGDGKKDISLSSMGANKIDVLRNASSVGSISFFGAVSFTAGTNPSGIDAADLDGDGKIDIVECNTTSNDIYAFRNTSTVGTISFAAAVTAATGSAPNDVVVGDIDGDGKIDVVTADRTANYVSVFPNSSSIGTISFTASNTYTMSASPNKLVIADVD